MVISFTLSPVLSFFLKNFRKKFGRFKKTPYLCSAFKNNGRLAQLV